MQIGTGSAIIFSGMLVPLLNRILGDDGWRIAWQVLGGISAAVAVAAAVLLRNSPADMGLRPMGEPDEPWEELVHPHRKVPEKGIVVHLGVLYFLFGLTYMIYGTFIVTTMVAERGLAEASAGRFWAWVGFFSIFSGMLFGSLSDRIGRKGGFMAVFLVQTLSYFLAGADPGMGSLYLSIALYGIAAWSIPTVMAAAVGDYLGPSGAAAGFSIVTFFFAAGQTVGPSLAGVIAERTGTFSTAYLLSAAATAIGALAASFLRRTREETPLSDRRSA
jgi:predicted MFS family arabinose efflux permease